MCKRGAVDKRAEPLLHAQLAPWERAAARGQRALSYSSVRDGSASHRDTAIGDIWKVDLLSSGLGLTALCLGLENRSKDCQYQHRLASASPTPSSTKQSGGGGGRGVVESFAFFGPASNDPGMLNIYSPGWAQPRGRSPRHARPILRQAWATLPSQLSLTCPTQPHNNHPVPKTPGAYCSSSEHPLL